MTAQLYYRASVEVFARRLESLAFYFDKGAAWAAERGMKDENFLGARIHADMLPLVSQVRIATDHAKGGAGRTAGLELPKWEDNEASVAEVKARIQTARDYLATFEPEQFAGVEGRKVTLKLREEMEFDAPTYLFNFATPNFYFHVVTAYDIIRAMGCPLGKIDFFGYSKP